MKRVTTDPITLEVVRNRLSVIADEMELTLLKSSFSPVIKEALDASAALGEGGGAPVRARGRRRHGIIPCEPWCAGWSKPDIPCIPGPAIIEQADTTTIVYPRWIAEVDSSANIVMTMMPVQSTGADL